MVGELDAAVQGVLGAGGELRRWGVEVVPGAAFAQRGERREAVLGEETAKQ
jgi:hypothetical protein